jgi:quercetin dioxygenase-like cupin family protein
MDTKHISAVEPEEPIEGVHLVQMANGEEMSIQHFTIEPGAEVPNHQHPHEQAGFVYQGELVYTISSETEIITEAGESYVIPGNEPHSAENRTDKTVKGIDIFSPPRLNPDWMD